MQASDTGRAMRDNQLALFQVRDAVFLDVCRAVAIEVIKVRGSVSINDVRARIFIPPEINPSVLGAVFRNKQFKAVGITEAAHPQAHARIVRVYTLNKEK